MDGQAGVTVEGKRAVVIGGTSGIGRAIAVGYAADGADVIASSRSEDRVESTAAELSSRGATTARVTCDVTDPDSLYELANVADEAIGGVDVVIASQGAISREALLDIGDAEWDRVVDIALNGVRRVVQAFAPGMDEPASIIVISSLTASIGMKNAPAYTAAKGGVEALVRAAAKELGPDIRVNAIAPGFVPTPQNEGVYAKGTEKRAIIEQRAPLARVATPEEMSGPAIFLGSDAASYVTGEVLTVDGGFAPSAL